MQKNGKLKKKAAALVSIVALCATALGGTYAYRDFKQHKSNELGGINTRYEARLVEDFVEIPDWKVEDGDVKKEIRVTNLGHAAAGYGDVYVRLQLKEFMEIGEVTYIETEKRYMIDTDGQFITFPTPEAALLAYPAHIVTLLTDKVTGATGYFIQTQEHDPNGQMGKYVLTDIIIGAADPVIPGSRRAVNINHHGVVTTDANGKKTYVTHSDECDYPIHPWNVTNLETRQYIDAYIEWQLNTGAIIRLSDWDGKPVAKWILDDSNADGWAYWGQPLHTDGDTTANLLNSVALINQPDGEFYYVIHVDMESVSLDELIKNDPDLGWNEDVRDSYTKNAPSAKFNGATPTTVEAGSTVASPSVTVGPVGAAQSPLTWRSSDTSIATVDANGVVTGVKAGGPVTITVIAPNGGRAYYTLNVTPGTHPATGVSINGGNREITVGQKITPTIDVTPANSTDVPAWSSSDSSIASVNPPTGELPGVAPGTATITVTVGSQTDSITVTVKPSTKPATNVTINGGDKELEIGGKYTPSITVTPADSTDVPAWSSSDNSIATVNPVTGEITGVAAGTATITVTVGGKTDSITVTVKPGIPPYLGTINGEGPYVTRQHPSDSLLDYSALFYIDKTDFANALLDRPGAIKLSDVLSGSDYSGLSIRADDPSLTTYFSVGTDKVGDDAILYTYFGTQQEWEAEKLATGKSPQITVRIYLCKAGFTDTPIDVTLSYNGSFYY
ncbi:MAG: Ig-like domain-containing protein [Oscillospiraceae bacterium]|jgi:uncharacterized protein YjdB|nr:Ig-like domain-containing protein [Oscillospiraceae bacterium]